jgi:hypothetical protein
MVALDSTFFRGAIAGCLLAQGLVAAELRATLEPQRVAVGEAANLSLRISGGDADTPTMPDVPNLIVQFQGKNQSISIINGVTSRSATFSFVVGSQKTGEYLITPITVSVGGQVLQAPPLKLTVFDDGTAKANDQSKDVADDPNRLGIMQVELTTPERQEIYLGEIAPVRIRAFFPMDAQVRLESAPQPAGGSFTLHNINEQPQQSIETKDGKPYRSLTWFGGISGTKSGTEPVQLTIKAVVAVPDATKPALRPRIGSRFPGGTRVSYVEENVTLQNQDISLPVKPLPIEGRPANFSGAVGEFSFDALDIPATWNTGEPQRVALRIKGSGNFAIMKAPELSPAELWKWYPGQDQFTPGDIASFSGSKVFQYNAIARRNGEHDVAFALSYFDPKQAKYLTIHSDTKRVSIQGEAIKEDEAKVAEAAAPTPIADSQGTMPLRESNHRGSVSAGLAGRVDFILLGGIVAFASALAPTFAWWRQRHLDPRRRANQLRQQTIAAAMRDAERHVRTQDAASYWQSARIALQTALAAQWRVQAHAISLHDVMHRCGSDSPVTAFFREADRWSYGAASQQPAWDTWRVLHQQALEAIPT